MVQPEDHDDPPERFPCTFEGCDKVWNTLKDMKLHKVYDIEHDYCKKCDIDFPTDLQHIIHRISTPSKHITCPLCGQDFKSKAALDGHCEARHPPKQRIKCLACQQVFGRLADIMQHIERDQCQIKREEFQLELAERRLQKEAFFERRNQESGSHLSHLSARSSDMSNQGGVSLLQGQGPQNDVPRAPVAANNDALLADVDDLATRLSNVNTSNDPNDGAPGSTNESIISNDPSHLTYNSTMDPSLSAHRKTTFKLIDFYDNVRNIYVCPGEHCRRTYRDAKDFHKHLLGREHTGGQTTCPSCLKNFDSLVALCAHMEAPSRKCNIRHSVNYNQVLREISAGLVGTGGHHADGSVKYIMPTDEGWAA